jgi:hypothetical protein
MKIEYCEQLSKTWFELCAGSIGGTRFGSVVSGKKNRLIYELLDEQLNGYVEPDDYVSDDMLFGSEQEPIARQLYSEQSGIIFNQVGMILSEQSAIHHASPDGLSDDGIVLEIKSTQNGYTQIQRFFEGVESNHIPQILNYFAVSDEVREVHWVSWCPSRTERPLVIYVFTRDSLIKDGKNTISIGEHAVLGRLRIKEIELQLDDMKTKFLF